MGFISATCPSCGGKLQLDDSRDKWYCQFCGNEIIKDKHYTEVSGNVNISGIATAVSLIERGFIELEYEKFDKAKELFERALDAEPKNWKAYLGRLLSDLKMTDMQSLITSRAPLTRYDDFNKAVRFAPDDDRKILEEINDDIEKDYKVKKKEFDSALESMNEDAEDKELTLKQAIQERYKYEQLYFGFYRLQILYIVAIIICVPIGLLLMLAISWRGFPLLLIGIAGIAMLIVTAVLKRTALKKESISSQAEQEYNNSVRMLNKFKKDNEVYCD